MAHVQLQYRRKLAGAPGIGRWEVWSSAWFETSTVVPSAAVCQQLQYLFLGMGTTGTAGSRSTDTRVFVTGADQGRVIAHEFTGGQKVKRADVSVNVPAGTVSAAVYTPFQAAVSIGYRCTTGQNTRVGRSRFWVGPLVLPGSPFAVGALQGGLRLGVTAVDQFANNAKSSIDGLAALGWELQVCTGRPFRIFNPVTELYVDDVIDVMRTRRPWQSYQKRVAV